MRMTLRFCYRNIWRVNRWWILVGACSVIISAATAANSLTHTMKLNCIRTLSTRMPTSHHCMFYCVAANLQFWVAIFLPSASLFLCYFMAIFTCIKICFYDNSCSRKRSRARTSTAAGGSNLAECVARLEYADHRLVPNISRTFLICACWINRMSI